MRSHVPNDPVRGPGRARRLAAALCLLGVAGLVLPAQAQIRPPAADDVANTAVELTRVYHGSDGSVFSTRAVGNTVVGFSQDASGQRAFVFTGTRSGMTITGHYYSVPKGADTNEGPLVLTLSNGGSTLTHAGGERVGATTWIAKLPSFFTFPKAREATFQSIASTDLDGAFKGSDGSRAYVRQYNATVAFLAEKFNDPADTRPAWATVFIGTRSGNTLSGQYYDLPHQTGTLHSGAFSGEKLSTERTFSQNLWQGVLGALPLRAMTYTADYAVDLDVFAQEIRNRMTPFTVGYSYAIAQDGAVVRHGADGDRRTPDGINGLAAGWPFTSETLNEMSSTTKTVTLVAVLRALRDRGISVDSPVAPYLPAPWVRGPGMDTVTFRDLLSHGKAPTVTGDKLTVAKGLFKPGNCKTDFYGCLRDAVAGGMTGPAAYDNIHYGIFRVILPFVVDPIGMANVFASSNDGAYLNGVYSLQFRSYMQWVLQLAGVNADFQYVLAPGETIAYRYAWGTPPTDEYLNDTSADDYLGAGPGGLKMKSTEFAKFLSRLEQGTVLPPVDVATAKAIGFGGTGPVAGPSGVGPLWTKNGGSGYAQSQLMVFPGTEVFITQNSTGNAAQDDGFQILMDAWGAALIGH